MGIVQVPEKLGFSAKANKPEDIFSKIPFSTVTHVVINKIIQHYVVIHKISQKEIIVGDLDR